MYSSRILQAASDVGQKLKHYSPRQQWALLGSRPAASRIQTKGDKKQTKQTQYQRYWQYCSIRMSMTLILTSALCCPLSLWGLSESYFEPLGPAAVFLPPLPLLLLLSTKEGWWLLHSSSAPALGQAENKLVVASLSFDWWHTTLSEKKGWGRTEERVLCMWTWRPRGERKHLAAWRFL